MSGTAAFPTLTAVIGGANNNQIILSGSATALSAGVINSVATIQSLCANTVAGCNLPASTDPNAPDAAGQKFTFHDLTGPGSAPVPVTAGQILQATVTISFCNNTGCTS